MDTPRNDSPTPTWKVALAWIVVTIPLGWGVYQSVRKSLPLLRPEAPTARSPR